MAKKKSTEFKLEEKPTNPTKVQSAFDDLETFINEAEGLTEDTRNAMRGDVLTHRPQTSLDLKDQVSNVAHLNSAILKVNLYL